MRILAIGDFHGEFPEKLKKEAQNADIILSPGDFANADEVRKIIFKNWTDKPWYEAVGLRKAKKLQTKAFNSGLEVMKELNSIGKKTYFVWGNTDFYKSIYSDPKSINPGYYNNKLSKLENMQSVDKRKIKIENLEIIGHGGYVDVTDFIKHPIVKDKLRIDKTLKRYNKTRSRLFNIFQEKPSKNFIFLIHYTPYGIFDKVKFKKSPMHGKHVGFEPYNYIIKKYKPFLVITGHMHEYQGAKKIGKTTIIATGPAQEGKGAMIEVENNKIKNIRFIR